MNDIHSMVLPIVIVITRPSKDCFCFAKERTGISGIVLKFIESSRFSYR